MSLKGIANTIVDTGKKSLAHLCSMLPPLLSAHRSERGEGSGRGIKTLMQIKFIFYFKNSKYSKTKSKFLLNFDQNNGFLSVGE